MKCTCGFKNAPDARFCGGCSLALGRAAGDIVPNAAVSGATTPAAPGDGNVSPHSRPLVAILAIVVVVAAAGYWWLHRPTNPHKPDNSGLYRIKVDGKYGFMDRAGKTVIKPQFDGAHGFSEGLAAVQVGTKFGFITTKGEVAIAPQFDATLGFSDGLAAVQVGTKFGYINTNGLVSITPQFDDVTSFHNGRAAVKLCCGRNWGADAKIGKVSNNRYGFIDKEGKYVGTPGFLFVQSDFGGRSGWLAGDVTLVRTADDRFGIMNGSGKVVIAEKVDEIGWDGFTDGLAPAATGGKWGYVDAKGAWAIAPQFEAAHGFEDGLAAVEVGQRWGLIDRNGKFVVNPQYDGIFGLSEGYAIFETGEGSIPSCQSCGNFGFINTKGQVVVDAKFVQHPDVNGGLRSPVSAFSEGLAAVKTDDGWGFIDSSGKMVIDPQFDDVGVLSQRGWPGFQDGLAFVTILGKEAYISKTGSFVVEPFPGTTVRAMKERTATYDRVLIGKWVDDDLSMTISKNGAGYLISWWGYGAANYQGNFQLVERKLIGKTFNEFRTDDENTIFDLSTDNKTITGKGYRFNLHKVDDSEEIKATFKIDRNAKDASGNPVSKISLALGSKIVYISSITGDAALFDKSSFDKMGIPANALAACGAWYAGSGDYFYIARAQTGIVVYRGYQYEGQRNYNYNWEKLKEIAK